MKMKNRYAMAILPAMLLLGMTGSTANATSVTSENTNHTVSAEKEFAKASKALPTKAHMKNVGELQKPSYLKKVVKLSK